MKLFPIIFLFFLSGFIVAQSPDANYIPGSSQKIEQLVGDWEFQYQQSTTNLTNTYYQLTRTDLGVPFYHNGKTYILFGDSQGGHTGDLDAIAYTTDNNPDDGLSITFLTDGNGIWNPIAIPGIDMGTFNVPTEGVSYNGNIYLYSTTDTMQKSLVSVSYDNGYTYQKLYDWSVSHFINVSIVEINFSDWNGFPPESGQGMAIFGSGKYRMSDVFFAYQNMNNIGTPTGIVYFAGLNGNGNPMWTPFEENAVSLFNQPCVGELSVTYNQFIKKWILTYNCSGTGGTNFRTADNPWGPWSQPKILFHGWNDGGYCSFIHVDWNFQNCDNAYDAGREYEWGGDYGPYQFPDFAKSTDGATNTSIYFTQSTWNPYTVVLMKSTLQLSTDTLHVNAAACSNVPYTASLNWTGSGTGWYVDISTDPGFATFQNKNIDNLSSTNAPAGFSGGLVLYPDTTYYWRIWNGTSQTYGTSFKVPNCNASPTDIQMNNPACYYTPYTNTISWTGSGIGWWIDISTDSTFATYSNKNVDNLSSTTAPAGFSAGLILQPNTTYYWRMWNGEAWTSGGKFNVPNCTTVIQEAKSNLEISVLPTIGKSEFTIQLGRGYNNKYSFEIYNAIGEKVKSEKKLAPSNPSSFEEASFTFSLNVPNGLYFVHIKTEDGEVVRKIVIRK